MTCRRGNFHSAFVKGFSAQQRGMRRDRNPYLDSGNTYGWAWRRAWDDGWKHADQGGSMPRRKVGI